MKKNNLVVVFGFVFALLALAGCKDFWHPDNESAANKSSGATPPVAVTGVSLDYETLTVAMGATFSLTATILPADATNQAVLWDSSDTDVFTVSDEGVITPVAVGKATITVTTVDGGKTATREVTITLPVKSIAVTSQPATTVYYFGEAEALDLADLVVTATFSDDTTGAVTITTEHVSGFNPATAGEQTVTITYDGKTATFTVTVKLVASLTVTGPDKTSYYIGDEMDTEGLAVTAHYDGGHTWAVPIDQVSIEGLSSITATAGDNKTITVAYGGKTATFTVTVRYAITVTVSPGMTTVVKGSSTTQFSAEVKVKAGSGSPSQAVTWTIVESVASGTSISGGTLTVASGETAGSLTVRATSGYDPTVSGTATVSIVDAGSTTIIHNLSDLEAFSNTVKDTNKNQNAIMDAGLTLTVPSNATYVPISRTPTSPYKGTFDGNGSTINITLSGSDNYLALFGINDGTIQNLTVTGTVTATGSGTMDYIAGVVAYNDIHGTVQGVVSKVEVTATGSDMHNIGGIVGFNGWDEYNTASPHYNPSSMGSGSSTYQSGGTVKQCRNEGDVKGGFNKIGGIVGENAGTVEQCVNTGTISCAKNDHGWPGVGGIVGRNGNNNTATEQGRILNCYNTGTIFDNTGGNAEIGYGGIAGWSNKTSDVFYCYNVGELTQDKYMNGNKGTIIGSADSVLTSRVNYNYSLDTIASYGAASNGTRWAQEKMQSTALVTALNAGNGGPYVFVSGGYPKLAWE